GHVAREEGESPCSPPEALTTTGPSRPGGTGAAPRPLGLLDPLLAVGSVTDAGSGRAADWSRFTPPYPAPGWSGALPLIRYLPESASLVPYPSRTRTSASSR